MISSLKIRHVKKPDLSKLAQIYARTYSVFDIGEKWTDESAYHLLRYWLEREPDLAFLVQYNEKIVGAFFVGVKPWWDGNHLVDGEIFVDPDYQKKGIGSALLQSVFEYAIKKYNVVRWDTYTVRNNYPFVWYKSLGFKEIKEWGMISADPQEVLHVLKREKR